MNIVFMGTPDFAEECLKAIVDKHQIQLVVTNPDKPVGRGMKTEASPVKKFAQSQNLEVKQPDKIRNNIEFIENIKDLKPDVLCVVAYGKILPKELLEIPKFGAVNVHGSLLPKYRGAAPIQWSVINGDEETGITTMFMDEGMDTGDMILKEKVQIGPDETTGELWERLSKVGANLLVETLDKIEMASKENSIKELKDSEDIKEKIKELVGAEKQSEEFSIAPKIEKEMAKIDWNKSGKEIKNLVRGLNPIMGTEILYQDKKLKIWKVDFIPNENLENTINQNAKNGEIVEVNNKKGILYVRTNDGVISILEIQGQNGKRMDIKSFLNGNKIEVGIIL